MKAKVVTACVIGIAGSVVLGYLGAIACIKVMLRNER